MKNDTSLMTRRQALKTTALVATTAATIGTLGNAMGQATTPSTNKPAAATGPFTVPPLPYAYDALEPHIDAKTMEIHYSKHHAAYVANLNKAIAEAPELAKKPIEELLGSLTSVPEKIRTAVRNQGGGHYNHSLFWQMMKKEGGGEPKGELAQAIDKSFGSFAGFKEKFTDAATKQFGSGWAWLVAGANKTLTIQGLPNQDAVILSDTANLTSAEAEAFRRRYGLTGTNGPGAAKIPILGIDVWEHAYYLKYQNRRPEYIAAWFNVINWDFANDQFAKAKA
jgi:Fe-Mn family superoxide dismutase